MNNLQICTAQVTNRFRRSVNGFTVVLVSGTQCVNQCYTFLSTGVCGSGCFLRLLCTLPPGPSPLHPESDPQHFCPVLGPKPAVLCQRDHALDIIYQRVPGPSHLCFPVSRLPQEAHCHAEPASAPTRLSDRDLHQNRDAQPSPLQHQPGFSLSLTAFSSYFTKNHFEIYIFVIIIK